MMKQVITIKPDGSLFGLDHKEDGVDLRRFGKAQIRRETLIQWSEERQMWFIKWFKETPHIAWTATLWQETMPWDEALPACANMFPGDDTIYFVSYKDAVAVEVRVVQQLQTRGKLVA